MEAKVNIIGRLYFCFVVSCFILAKLIMKKVDVVPAANSQNKQATFVNDSSGFDDRDGRLCTDKKFHSIDDHKNHPIYQTISCIDVFADMRGLCRKKTGIRAFDCCDETCPSPTIHS
jgi:hypothetical protein